MKSARLLSVRQAAELVGVTPRVMRRRLRALHERYEGKLLQSFEGPGRKVRKWWIPPEVLQACLRADHDRQDAELEDLRGRVTQVEDRTLALRGAHRQLRKHVNRIDTWREGTEQAILGISKMLGLPGPMSELARVGHRRPRRPTDQ